MEELKQFAREHKFITFVIVLFIIGLIGNIFGSEETSTRSTYSGPNSAPISSSPNPYSTANCVRIDAATVNKINNNANTQYGAKLDTRGAYGVKIRSEYSMNYFLAAKYIAPASKAGSVDAFLVSSLTNPSLILPASQSATIAFNSAGSNAFKTAPSLLGKSVEAYEEFFEAVGCVMYPPAY
tara:strand:+ start:306 stop:851 length:546 start_codon:yes stop_codon:yes gene_type:complete